MRLPETSANDVYSTLRALEEFTPEQIDQPAPTNGGADTAFSFNRGTTPHPPPTVVGSLLAIAPARISEARVEPFSRIEETEAKRRRRRASQLKSLTATLLVTSNRLKNAGHTLRSGAQQASIAADTSVSRIGTRTTRSAALVSERASSVAHHGRCAVRRVAARMRTRSAASQARLRAERETILNGTQYGVRVLGRAFTRFIGRSAQADPVSQRGVPIVREFNGTLVASVLAIAVIGYGGFLATFWQAGATGKVTEAAVISSVPAPARPTGESSTVGAPPDTGSRVAQPSATEAAPAAIMPSATKAAPAAILPNARTLAAIWARRDTRTLDRAFATLRQETLAFRTCGMRVTDVHRAVARCEGVVPARSANGRPSSRFVMWTIEFQRTDGRWLIADVTTR
jgi:hypothetical protein